MTARRIAVLLQSLDVGAAGQNRMHQDRDPFAVLAYRASVPKRATYSRRSATIISTIPSTSPIT